ncbi:MAG: LacI family DNA-binding transcriptional regulator [Planctomycetota bacterium]|jgi:LacI family transcriptional regulator
MAKKQNTTLKNIAEKLNVSATTVSRVLSGQSKKYRISKKTEQNILKAVKELNFSPNQLARGLRLNKTLTIGLVIPDISNPFFASIAHSVEIESRKYGYSIMLCDSQEDTDLEIESLNLLQSRKADGVIICPVGISCEHMKKIQNSGMPIVTVDRYFPNSKLPYVTSNNFQGAFDAVSYLIQNRHRNIACIQGITETMPNKERVKGYQEALNKNNVRPNKALIVGDSFGERNGYIETKLLLKKEKNLTAVFALSNLIGLGAFRAIREERLIVPDDISIICFDDQPYSEFLSTPMTTVRQQNCEMGEIAIKLLFNQIKSPDQVQSEGILLPTKLIKRDSVKKLN